MRIATMSQSKLQSSHNSQGEVGASSGPTSVLPSARDGRVCRDSEIPFVSSLGEMPVLDTSGETRDGEKDGTFVVMMC